MGKTRDSFFLSEKISKNMNRKREKPATITPMEDPKVEAKVKKPFDKKTYRLKKYSKKYKLEQWEEQRKKKVLRQYQKDISKDSTAGLYKPINFDELSADESDLNIGKFVRHPDFIEEFKSNENTKRDPYGQAKEKYNKIKEEQQGKKEEMAKVKEERKQKLLEYKKKKAERFKKLSQKTRKGQPVMTGRLELLLEKIQQSK